MIEKIKTMLKQMSCVHKDVRYKLPINGCKYNKKHKYVEICIKCGAISYVRK